MNKTNIAQHTFVSEWSNRSAPNGSISCRERTLHHVTVYTAFVYGKTRTYASGCLQIETAGGIGPRYGAWDDGSATIVSSWLAAIEAAVA